MGLSSPLSAVHLLIQGRVQGVGFRFYIQECAVRLSLAGWVRNTPDGTVEAYAEGPRTDLETLIRQLHKGPPLSRVDAVRSQWVLAEGHFTSFDIR